MTMTNETGDFEIVRQDPAAWYRQPQAILRDGDLTVAEKRSLLEEWAQDLADRSNAAGEGMVPETHGQTDTDLGMQDNVIAALATLEGVADSPERPTLAARIWRRITGADQASDPVKVTE